jgi:gamma-glutamyltranspeptidase/glutathione hydrolase
LPLLCVYCLVSTDAYAQTPKTITQYLPDQWPKQDLKHYLTLQNGFDQQSRKYIHPQKSADNANGMIAGTSEPFAVHAGLEILKHGGNAADAALTTAVAQVALTTGAAISYAGILNAVYYDAASHRVYTLNAAYNTVRNEKDPRSIPGWGEHSGRSALIPGFMAGVQALHDRFGKLPFPMLFGPAIWIGDNGVLISPVVGGWISSQKDFITRIPETKRIFAKPDGQLHKTGDVFRQPELSSTLKQIAALGSTYMYKGAWAHHFVELDRREGGKITLEDLDAYRPVWTAPLHVSYGDYDAVSLGPPNVGGAITLGSLKLAGIANLKKYGNYAASAEALYYLIQIERATASFASESASVRRKSFPDVDPSPASLLNRSLAGRLWTQILGKTIPTRGIEQYRPNHSAGILAIDEQGNVACIVHSLNGVLWGQPGYSSMAFQYRIRPAFNRIRLLRLGPEYVCPRPQIP